MTFIIMLAAALSGTFPASPFGQPVSDGDLATTTSVVGQRLSAAAPPAPMGLINMPTAEVVDCWWAYDGAALIAEAVRPTPTMPAGIDSARLQGGMLTLQFTFAVIATTRP